ncbi:hypothetical protein ACLOJK_031976 [Asimina triloba]
MGGSRKAMQQDDGIIVEKGHGLKEVRRWMGAKICGKRGNDVESLQSRQQRAIKHRPLKGKGGKLMKQGKSWVPLKEKVGSPRSKSE